MRGLVSSEASILAAFTKFSLIDKEEQWLGLMILVSLCGH